MKITIRLRPDRDDDIKEWYQSLPRGDRSRFIRDVLKDFFNHKKSAGPIKSFNVSDRLADIDVIEVNPDLDCSIKNKAEGIDSKLDKLLDHI